MTKLLDLRDKGINKVRVVEHIIFKPRSFKVEMIKMLSIIAIVSVLGWGISNADNLNPFLENGIETATQNFSSLGTVSEITESNIILVDARGSDESGNTTYDLNITNLEKIETSANAPLLVTDIKVGDKIIAQGLTNGSTFFIKRIVSFSTTETASSTLSSATTTTDVATSTPETATTTTDTASSTTEVSTSTPESISNESTTTPEVITETSTTTTEEATTTPSIIETVEGVVQDVIETVTEIVETVVETVTGSEPEPTPPPVEEPTPETVPNPEPVI